MCALSEVMHFHIITTRGQHIFMVHTGWLWNISVTHYSGKSNLDFYLTLDKDFSSLINQGLVIEYRMHVHNKYFIFTVRNIYSIFNNKLFSVIICPCFTPDGRSSIKIPDTES